MYVQSKQSLILCFTLNVVWLSVCQLALVLGIRLGLKMILGHMCPAIASGS